MKKVLLTFMGVAILLALTAALAAAGLNPTATARIYWQTGSTGAGSPDRNSTAGVPQLVVTASYASA